MTGDRGGSEGSARRKPVQSSKTWGGEGSEVTWRPLTLLESGDAIRRAVSEWHDMLSKGATRPSVDLIARVAMLNDRSVVIRPATDADEGSILFVGRLVSKPREALAQEILDSPMPPRPRAWACSSKSGSVTNFVCLPFEGDEPRMVVLFDD